MRCKKCGKVMRKNENFCESCGYYNGEKTSVGWDDKKQEDLLEEKENGEVKEFVKFDLKSNSSSSKEDELFYENEDLLEAYIGEDYKAIKKRPFNFFAFLLNWSYVLYRKLYITGVIGLIITAIIAINFREILIPYWIIMSIVIGFTFNFYYIFVSKRKIEMLMMKYEETDKFGLMNICEEKGGTSLSVALIAYIIFILIIFFSYVRVGYNQNNNTKYWQENSENKATCTSLAKAGFNNLEVYKVPGKIRGAACKVSKANFIEYDLYVKTAVKNNTYYTYYHAEKDGMVYKSNTSEIKDLELNKLTRELTEEEQTRLNSLKQLENNYNDIIKQAEIEDKLIKTKKNKSEKLNYYITRAEIIR